MIKKKQQPTIISFVKDLPNICSLIGLFCAFLAICVTINSYFHLAMALIIWSVLFDWADGRIARKLKGRTPHQRQFGGHLDSLIDIVSFGIFPAIFLLMYADFNPWFFPGAFLIVAGVAMRLSYFNIFGMNDNNYYVGLAVDNNAIVLVFVFLFESLVTQFTFSIILYISVICLFVCNISPILTPKLTGKWFAVLALYTIITSSIYTYLHFQ